MCPECFGAAAQAIAGVTPAGALAAIVFASVRRQITAAGTRDSKEGKMTRRIVPRAEWVTARKELLTAEKELTRHRDDVARAVRRLPMVEIEKEYVFDGPQGPVALRDLFDGRSQLIVYHFMFDPTWEEGCKSCSHLADNV